MDTPITLDENVAEMSSPHQENTVDLTSYDTIIVTFSGGKDSLACVLHLLEEERRLGVDLKSKIELWHHDVDGDDEDGLMDWPVTTSYCRAIAKAFDLPIYFSWKVGGFEREMLRDNARTAPIRFETPDGFDEVGGERGKLSTRLRFPQVSADLNVRWCSAYLKIDVGAAAIRNQARFDGKRTLVLSGERAQESTARANYETMEPDRSHCVGKRVQRHVDRWRPVHGWSEVEVWKIIERWKVAPHPAYVLGWGRVSCMACIFGSPNQWASVRKLAPEKFERIANYEDQFGTTIKRKDSVRDQADKGTPYTWAAEAAVAAMSREFDGPVFLENWTMPLGALKGESCGPT